MKNLLLALTLLSPLLSPLPARAELTNGGALSCDYQNTSMVQVHLVSTRGGIKEGAKITMIANGNFHVLLDFIVTAVRPARGALLVDVKTANHIGVADQNSGEGTVRIALAVNPDDTIRGLGDNVTVELSKAPVNPPLVHEGFRWLPRYELVRCKGTL